MVLSPEEFARDAREGMRAPSRYTPDHPVVKAIQNGTLSLDQMRKWAVQTCLFLQEHMRVFALVFGNCPDPAVRAAVLKVIVEEEMGYYTKTARHVPYMERFCRALGVTPQQLEKAKPNSTTSAAIGWWLKVAKEGSFIEGWGTWAFSNQRAAFGRMYEGLKAHYKFSPEDIFFFELHSKPFQSAEESAKDFAAVSKHLNTEEAQEQARRSGYRLAEHWMAMWTDALKR